MLTVLPQYAEPKASTSRTYYSEDAMKAYFNSLPMKTWLVLVVLTLSIAYPIACLVIPAVIHAIVPEVVRNVLTVL